MFWVGVRINEYLGKSLNIVPNKQAFSQNQNNNWDGVAEGQLSHYQSAGLL